MTSKQRHIHTSVIWNNISISGPQWNHVTSLHKSIKLFKHNQRNVKWTMFKALRIRCERNIKKQTSMNKPHIHYMTWRGNQARSRDWKGTFLSQANQVVINKNHFIANSMGCHSSIKCITWPLHRPGLRRFSFSSSLYALDNSTRVSAAGQHTLPHVKPSDLKWCWPQK